MLCNYNTIFLNVIDLVTKTQRIKTLEQQTKELTRYKQMDIPFKEVSDEAKINYKDIENFSYYRRITTDFDKTDTIPVIVVRWNSKLRNRQFKDESAKLEAWLKYKLKIENLVVSNTQ